MNISPVAVIGAGGHSKVIISTLQAARYDVAGIYDDDPMRWNQTILGVPVIGGVSRLMEQSPLTAVIAIGNNTVRKRIALQFPQINWLTLVHPFSYVHESVQLGQGTVVLAGTVIQPDVSVGTHVILNTAVSIDHDCCIGDFVHIAPGTHLAGSVNVQEGALLGIGSTVIPGCRIGEWATVGAGGVVIREIPANALAIGVPATLVS